MLAYYSKSVLRGRHQNKPSDTNSLFYSIVKKSSSLTELMSHVRDGRQSLDSLGISLAVSKAAKLMNKSSQSDVKDFLELLEIARGYSHQMDTRSLSTFLYFLAKTNQHKEDLIREILDAAKLKLRDFNPQGCAYVLWALATLNCRSGYATSFIRELLKVAELQLRDFSAPSFSNTLWALAKLNYQDASFVRQLLKEAEPKLKEFKPQELSSSIWALATLKYSDCSTFMKAFLQEAEPKLSDFQPSNFSNTIWALASLHCQGTTSFIKTMLKEAEPTLKDFNPQALSITLWALATLKYSDGVAFIKRLLKAAESKLSGFKPQNLANTIWALVVLNYRDGAAFIDQMLIAAESKLWDFSPQNLSITIWALASLKYTEGLSFIKHFLVEAEPKLRDFNARDLANTVWALAALNYQDGSSFVKCLLREVKLKLRELNSQDLANIAWSLAVLDHSDAPLFLTNFLSLTYQIADKMNVENKLQSLQYLLLMEDRGHVTAEIKADSRYVNLRRICMSAECHERISRTQSGVLQLVRRLPGCSEAIYEHSTEDGLFTMDIALLLSGGQKLAIEVDGPSHFLSDWKSFSGNTALRNCLLENRGWKVVSVSASDWFTLNGDDERTAYLKAKLGHYLDLAK